MIKIINPQLGIFLTTISNELLNAVIPRNELKHLTKPL